MCRIVIDCDPGIDDSLALMPVSYTHLISVIIAFSTGIYNNLTWVVPEI